MTRAVSGIAAIMTVATACGAPAPRDTGGGMDLQGLSRLGTVDERYQSYNIEMAAVTGGDFWKPYGAPDRAVTPSASPDSPIGPDPDMFDYRPPRDLANPRLRTLAAALGPAYVRASGTWANTTYFADTDAPPTSPPDGFKAVLTREQWRGVVDFADAVGAEIVSSFAISPGVRDASGRWTPDLAKRWLDFTRSIGGRIVAAEFMNEPNGAGMGGAPHGYTAADYGRDFAAFTAFVRREAPEMTVLGPGSVGETPAPWGMINGENSENIKELIAAAGVIPTPQLLAAAGPGVDAFSYHHYGAGSQRCAGMGIPQTSPNEALTEDWLGRTSVTRDYYGGLRDQYVPGKPLWVTEVADAACGGNPWAGTFLDSFRYVDQLGRLAREGVQVVIHNTLESSDYALLDEDDFTPRPNYWSALLWRRLMGSTVLDSGLPIRDGMHVYSHCQPDTPGGVTLAVINNDRTQSRTLALPATAQRYTLDADPLDAKTVRLNGETLRLGPDDSLPTLDGVPTGPGELSFAPATITFLTVPGAGNPACR